MRCPKCKTEYLRPTKLEDGLPVMGCQKCNGSFVSLLHYRDWAERSSLELQDTSDDAGLASDSDTKSALCCPKCARLMTKYVVSGALDARLDLCGNCDEAWLDGDEWRLLKSLKLGGKLPSIFTDHWQRKVRSERATLSRIERLKKAVGESEAEKAIEAKAWLSGHPNRSIILQFLSAE